MMVSHCVTSATSNYFKPTKQEKNSTDTTQGSKSLHLLENLNVHSKLNDFDDTKVPPVSGRKIQ
jgi:hypothetical protein